MFQRAVREARVYGEYGCGASTLWVLRHTQAVVASVETSREWATQTLADADSMARRLKLEVVDLGPVGDWGRPQSYAERDRFVEYTDWIWQQSGKPDVVLIDGRFRVACFLTSLKFARLGTNILFDDYVNRPNYHVVEELVPRSEECGRQCRFVVPAYETLDAGVLDELLEHFRYVMD